MNRSCMLAERRGCGCGEADEVGRHQPGALVQQLVEGVLAVGARLAPHDLAGVASRPASPSQRHRLAVALHAQLLQVGGEAGQVLAVGQHRLGLGAEEVDVPDRDQPEQRPGRFRSNGAVRKCSSMAWKPASISPELLAARWRPSATARSPSRTSSGRRPSPRTRTCSRCRCRTRRPSRRWWTRRRSAWRPRCSSPSRARRASQRARLAGVGQRLEGGERLRARRRTASSPGRGRASPRRGRSASMLETNRKVDASGRCSRAAPRRPSPGRGRSRRCRC